MLLGMYDISTTHAVQARMPLTGKTFSSPSRQLIVDDFPAPAPQPMLATDASPFDLQHIVIIYTVQICHSALCQAPEVASPASRNR